MKREQAGYMTAYMKKYRQVRAGESCACGRVAIKRKCCEPVCARCEALETLASQLEFRSAELRELAGRKGQGGWGSLRTATRAARPTGIGMTEQARRFVARVWEQANEIVVQGHGEYHLPVGAL